VIALPVVAAGVVTPRADPIPELEFLLLPAPGARGALELVRGVQFTEGKARYSDTQGLALFALQGGFQVIGRGRKGRRRGSRGGDDGGRR
jgi:hypothetical protein